MDAKNILIKLCLVVCMYAAANADRAHTRRQAVKSDAVNRIFKGETVVAGVVPFIVRLSVYTPMDPDPYTCGGALIAKNWVITAAHCVENYESSYLNETQGYVLDGFSIKVMAGDVSQTTTESTEVQKTVTQVYIHGNYGWETLENDIALLYVEDGFVLGDNIKTVNVGAYTPAEGTTVTVAGWGTTESADHSDTLLRTTYTVPTQSKCVSYYKNRADESWPVLTGMWCTGFDNMSTNSAQGDSGGPVFKKYSASNTTLYGLVSWGEFTEDTTTYSYDVNTEVAYYSTWVTGIMSGYSNYRQKLTATATPQTLYYTSGSNTLVYMMYNISCAQGSYVKISITKLTIPGDLSHLQLRSGSTTASPILAQIHQPLSTNSVTEFISTTNAMLIIFRTSDLDLTTAKTLQFSYVTSTVAGSLATC